MYCTTVSTAGYINIITIHITNNTTYVAYNKVFISLPISTYHFSYKLSIITSTGSHNVATIIDTLIDSTFAAKISGYAAYVMGATYGVFFICCISYISINSTANNSAYIASPINMAVITTISDSFSTNVSAVFNIGYSTIRRNTCNTADIGYIHFLYNTICSIVSSGMIFICSIIIFCCFYRTAVFGILYSTIRFHIADYTAYVVSTGYVKAVVNEVSTVANSSIISVTNQTTNIMSYASYSA